MKVIVVENYDEVSQEASQLVEEKVKGNGELVLGLATGSTPLGLYENLIDGHKTRNISYENVKTINLDEYLGLEKTHPASYNAFMYETLFKHVDVNLDQTYIPNGV
ncbi:6-phosphogluconolactonase, partial [Microvirga sp. 3-52]|nr:6-phosphogluconolactonase [Microvirga sp. 3-52]